MSPHKSSSSTKRSADKYVDNNRESPQGSLNIIQKLQIDLQRVLQGLAKSLKADVATLWLYDAESDQFGLPVRYGVKHQHPSIDPILRPGTHRGGDVIVDNKKPIIFNDITNTVMDGPFARRENIKSSAGFPIIFKDQSVGGVIFISYRSSHDFTDEDKKVIENKAEQAASIIAEKDIFSELRKSYPVQDLILKPVTDLAFSILRKPVAIWLAKTQKNQKEIVIKAMTGVTPKYFESGTVNLDDNSEISQVYKKCEEVIRNYNKVDEAQLQFRKDAVQSGWNTTLCFPIIIGREPVGVIEVLGQESNEIEYIDRTNLQHLANVAGAVIANARLGELASTVVKTPNISVAIKLIVDNALKLTGADASAIFILNKSLDRFVISNYAPDKKNPPPGPSEAGKSLINDNEKSILIFDASDDYRAPDYLIKNGFNSLIGVKIEVQKNERIGDLYVYGKNKNQFKLENLRLLETLAVEASVALGWTHLHLESANEIEKATDPLFDLDKTLDRICQNIKQTYHFDFVAVQLIDWEKRIIETIKIEGTKKTQDWAFLAKHSLDTDPDLRDIQVDVELSNPPRIEVISGWDRRFDPMIYHNFNHKNYERTWIPIILIKDKGGTIVKKWYENAEWEIVKNEKKTDGKHIALELQMETLPKYIKDPSPSIIGTIEGGYYNKGGYYDHKADITPDQVRNLAKEISQYGLEIYNCLLPSVLETIVKNIRSIVNADFATLFFFFNPDIDGYVYKVGNGKISGSFLDQHPPRPKGLGQEAIEAGEPRFLPDPSRKEDLKEFNPNIYKNGVRAMAACPLLISKEGNNQKKGILYICFNDSHWFTEDEIGWVKLLASRAVDAIRHATYYTEMRDSARRLANLYDVAKSLVINPGMSGLLQRIAGNTLNILTADVVIIYEYNQAEQKFSSEPTYGGRLKFSDKLGLPTDGRSLPVWLVKNGENLYEPNSERNPIFGKKNERNGKNIRGELNFVSREDIKSTAGILLKSGEEIVGAMFVNYRRHHEIIPAEEQILNMLASTAAIAIQNQRLLQQRQDLMVIAHQLRGPLTAAIGNLTLLKRRASLYPETQKSLTEAQAFVEDTLALSSGLFTALAHETGRKFDFDREEIAVDTEVRKLCERLKFTNERPDLEFEYLEPRYAEDTEHTTLQINREILTSVMYSLIHNAMKYAAENSTVTFEYSLIPPVLKVRNISSETVPVQLEDREKLFGMFEKGDNIGKGRLYGGVGIGLWVARKLMRVVGGDLTLSGPDDREPRTWEFVVHFPSPCQRADNLANKMIRV